MRANSNQKYNESYIDKKLSEIPIEKLSKVSNYCKRKPRKILPAELIKGFFLMIFGKGEYSYQNWADKVGLLVKTTITKQALWKRMTIEQVEFLRKIFERIFTEMRIKALEIPKERILKYFNNVFIEDGTHFQLNEVMSKAYPGNKYWDRTKKRMGKKKAILKIQATYNVVTQQFARFIIGNYRSNDQQSADTTIEYARQGDLVIRDLGYFSSKVFKSLQREGISFISRLRMKVAIFTVEDEKPIDLAKMLRKRGIIDREVLISQKEKTPVRLIALPVEESVAKARRRKARKTNKTNLTKEQLFFMGYHFFITDVSADKLSMEDIALLYRIRWHIEIIFKSWKSCLKMTNIKKDTNQYRLESYLYCMLIFIVLLQVDLFNNLSEVIFKKHKITKERGLSLIKFTKYIVNNITLFVLSYQQFEYDMELIEKQIVQYCIYESRNDRVNFHQLLLKLS